MNHLKWATNQTIFVGGKKYQSCQLMNQWQLYSHFGLKSSQYLNELVLLSLIASEIFQQTHRYRYQFIGAVMTNMRSTNEIIQFATLRISRE